MIAASQNANGPASAPTLPDHGSDHPSEEIIMNEGNGSTAPGGIATPKFERRLDLEDSIIRVSRFVDLTVHLVEPIGLDGVYTDGGKRYQRISEADAILLVFTAYEAADAVKAMLKSFEASVNAGDVL